MSTFFGDLALELRISIYRELLTSDKPVDAIKYRSRRHAHMKPPRKNNLHPAILRTCKQAYFEALKYLYEENRIRFDFFDDIYIETKLHRDQWYGLSKSNLMRIKHLEIAYCDAARDNGYDYETEYEDYDWVLVRLVDFLASLKCSLTSFRLSFRFYAQQRCPFWLTSDAPEILAQSSNLRDAIAAFPLKSTVEIVVISSEQDDCKEFVPLALAVGSMRQWALTLDKDLGHKGEVVDEDDDDNGEGEDDDNGDDDYSDDDNDDWRHIWTFTLRPATPSTQGQIPVLPIP